MFASMLLPAIPVFAVGGVLITSDTPLVCCWTWASVWAFRAIRSDGLRAWAVAGVIGALGVMAKYTMLAFPASIGLYLFLSPRHRRELTRPGFWMMSALCAGLGMAPIVIWNAQHGWAGAGQLAHRLGFYELARWANFGPVLNFLGGEIAVLGVACWAVGFAALRAAFRELRGLPSGGRRWLERDPALYLICLWGVLWCVCLAASFLGETEANWMSPGYVALAVLIGWRVEHTMTRGGNRARVYVAAWCASIAVVVTLHHTEWFYPLLARHVPTPTRACATPLRLIDVTARMRGHQELTLAVERKLEALRTAGEAPFVLTPTYALASTLEFYLPGQPQTYCLSWNYGMTPEPVNQHDLWHPNPRNDPSAFRGRAIVVVEDANMPPSYSNHLRDKGVVGDRGTVERIVVEERGVIVGTWDITVCRDYRGLAHYDQDAMYRPSDPRALRDPLSLEKARARHSARFANGRSVDTPEGAR